MAFISMANTARQVKHFADSDVPRISMAANGFWLAEIDFEGAHLVSKSTKKGAALDDIYGQMFALRPMERTPLSKVKKDFIASGGKLVYKFTEDEFGVSGNFEVVKNGERQIVLLPLQSNASAALAYAKKYVAENYK